MDAQNERYEAGWTVLWFAGVSFATVMWAFAIWFVGVGRVWVAVGIALVPVVVMAVTGVGLVVVNRDAMDTRQRGV